MSDDPTSAEAIREAIMRAFRAGNDIANIGVEGVLRAWDEVIAPSCEGKSPGQPFRPISEIRKVDAAFYAAFPDYHRTYHAVVVDLPFAAVHWTITGTQTGEFRDMPPTGRPVSVSGVSLIEFEGGRARRWWLYNDPS